MALFRSQRLAVVLARTGDQKSQLIRHLSLDMIRPAVVDAAARFWGHQIVLRIAKHMSILQFAKFLAGGKQNDSKRDKQENRQRGWRRRVGNYHMYDTIGATQFAILTLFFGLRERHKLLEIGAGSLRAARFLIPYLDAGHYCGVEPNNQAVKDGIAFELGPEMAKRCRPRFAARDDFGFHVFQEKFDYALAYSLFTHLPPPQIPIVFENVAKCFHDNSIMLATAIFAEGEERIVDPHKWTGRPTNTYSLARFDEAARAEGLTLIRLGRIFQDWFVAFRSGNPIAERGAQEIRKVAWEAVTPAWEDPGWTTAQPHGQIRVAA